MTVLNIIEITNDIPLYLGILFAVIFVIGLAVTIYETITCNSSFGFCLGLVLMVIGFISGSILWTYTLTTPPHKEYQVIIDEKTKFHEVYDKYEVLEVNGYIYTLKDREPERTDEK